MEPTREDHAAVLAATLLRQALSADDAEIRARLEDEALSIARESLGEEAIAEGCTYDDHAGRSSVDVIRVLVQRIDHAGRTRLAEHLLESLGAADHDPIESGRILWDRSRVSRKLGHLDLAAEQCLQLMRDARRLKSPELVAKAHYGLASIAEARGNFVEFRARVQRLIRIARSARLERLRAGGHSGLATSQAMAGRYGDAVANFWKAYELTGGRGQIARAALGNLAQTLLISGRPMEARKVSTVLLEKLPTISVLPSLGTYALASAQLGDSEAVQWASAHARRLAKSLNHPREVAEALMECSAALEATGERVQSGVMQRRAESIATEYGFHALTFREAMLSVQRIAQPPRFPAAAAEATAAIVEMDVPRIPTLAAASSV